MHKIHVANMAMVIDIDSDTELGRCDDAAKDTSDVMWRPEYAAPNLLLSKLEESSHSAVTTICIDEEVLDWGNDNDDGMGTLSPIPNQSFHRMSF